MRYALTVMALVLRSLTVIAVAQNQTLKFEVASIRPAQPLPGFHGGACHGVDSKYRPQFAFTPPGLGRCLFVSTTLRGLIEFAYKQPGQPFLIASGGDKWITSDHFRVDGIAPSPVIGTEIQLRLMLQTLLADRFKLQFHRDSHTEQGFALLATKEGARLDAAATQATMPGVMAITRDPAGTLARGEQVDLQTFANFLSSDLQQPVQDETGLEGIFNIALKWTPSAVEWHDPGTQDVPAIATGPSLFTALVEQLGLRLEPRKIMIPSLVIDHAEKPSEN